MSKWKIACGAAILAAGLVPAAHADDFTKLTLLTFSGPVDVPGITLPAGTYRFSLADPESGRRVVKVADKDGTKTYGMFISMPNERMTPTDKPVVMFKETAAGAPPAVQVWFYPGETYGYEFAYPHEQALKIAKATHRPVLSYNDHSDATATETDRVASLKHGEVTRIDENDKPVSTDEALKESSEPRTPVATTGSASAAPAPTTASTSAPAPAADTTADSGRASDTTTNTASRRTNTTTARSNGATANTVGTTGTRTPALTPDATPRPARKHLPRTASELPLLALISGLSLASAFGLRLARKTL